MSITVGRNQLKLVLDKLEEVKLELLRLRALLLPEEGLNKREMRKIEEAQKEIRKGLSTNLEDLIKELG